MEHDIPGQGPQQAPSDSSAYSPEAYQRAATALADQNPDVFDRSEPNPNPEQGSFFKRLFTTGIFGGIGHAVRHPVQTAMAAERGVGHALTEGVTTLLHVTDPHTFGVTRDPTALTSWWDEAAKPTVDEGIQRAYGPDATTGPEAFVQSATQFATGMYFAGRVFKLPASVSLPTRGLVHGAVADFSAFDPHEKWLANAVADGPDWFAKPVAQFLAVRETDSELAGRIKHAGEGAVLGAAFEGLHAMYRSFRTVMSSRRAAALAYQIRAIRTIAAQRAGKLGGREAAEASIIADLDQAQRMNKYADPQDIVDVVQTADGRHAVVETSTFPNGEIPTAPVAVPDGTPTFDNVAQADGVASAINTNKHNADLPPGLIDVDDEMSRSTLDRRGMSVDQIEAQNREKRAQIDAANNTSFNRARTENPLPSLTAPKGTTTPNPELADAIRRGDTETVDRLTGRSPAAQLTPAARTEWQQYVDRLSSGEDAMVVLKDFSDNSSINFNYVQDPQQIQASVRAIAEVTPPNIQLNGAMVQTHEQTRSLASDMFKDLSEDDVLNYAQRISTGTTALPQTVYGLRSYLMKLGRRTWQLSVLAEAFPENAVAHQNLADALETMSTLHTDIVNARTNVARTLEQQKIPVSAESVPEGTSARAAASSEVGVSAEGAAASTSAEKVVPKATVSHRAPANTGSVTAGRTRSELRALARQVFLSEGDPAEILGAITTPRSALQRTKRALTTFERINSYRLEMMLSGPRTHVINAVSNALTLMQRPVETWWAGVPTPFRPGSAELRQQGADMLAGMFTSLSDSWAATKKSFFAGENLLDPGRVVSESVQGVSTEWSQQNWLQRLFRAPSRLLMTSDEFFSQMNYRVNLRSQILRQAREQGFTNPRELATRLTEQMPFGFNASGAATNPVSLQYARIGTFKNDLEFGLGQWLQEGANNHPAVRLILPFVRTPTNLFRYAWERTPVLAQFSQIVQNDIAAGGERAALARAKIELGGAVWTTAAILAYNGIITGRGPSDPELRKQWRDLGNQPYSINTPLGQISFRRGDPIMSPFGVVADIMQMAGDMKDEDLGKVFYSTVASIASNVTSKTYMQGLSQMLDALSSGDWAAVRRSWYGIVSSFTPNVLNQANPDNIQREVRSVVDQVAARVPAFSTTLEPRRNLFGEKVLKAPVYVNNTFNPFTVMASHKNGDVADAILSLGRAFTMPPEKIAGGQIDLTDRSAFAEGSKAGQNQSPYDRWMELMGQPIGGMPPVRQQLETLVQSDAYKQASSGSNDVAVGGLRYVLASRFIQAHKAAAWGRVLTEYPALIQAMTQARINVAQSLTGMSPSVDQAQDILTP